MSLLVAKQEEKEAKKLLMDIASDFAPKKDMGTDPYVEIN